MKADCSKTKIMQLSQVCCMGVGNQSADGCKQHPEDLVEVQDLDFG